MSEIRNWDLMSRDQKIQALAFGEGVVAVCPDCKRSVAVVRGYWSQHSDPSSWEGRQPVRQCTNELRPVGSELCLTSK